MEEERVELEADIEKLHHTLEEDRNQWQYDYIVDSDDDDSEEDDDVLYIDLEKQGSAAASVASISARSAGDKTISSAHSTGSQGTSATETQSVATEPEDDVELFREVGVMQEELDAVTSMPATLESCLILNKAYQDVIHNHISRIELELAENREAQKHIEEEAKESTIKEMTKKRFPYNATLPYFKMKFGSTPAQNEDTRLKRLTDEPDLDKRPEKAWHAHQKTHLTEAVADDAMEKILQPLMRRRELEEEKLDGVGKDTEQWLEIKERIARVDREIEGKRRTTRQELLKSVDPNKVDWMKIANITFEGRRDWMACRRAWVHSMDPRLNQQPMTQGEEEQLVALIRETNGTNWTYIAQKLGTGRTPFQCLQYFQQNLNTEMLDRPWTKEEDEELVKVVEKCQHYHFNWRKVSHYMEGRSGIQCYKRYSKLDPNINKGYWTEAEDAQLMTAVQLLGTHNWGRVKELVPGRTREQCRERYCNSLDPSISGQPWTYEEDKKLLKLVAHHGKGNWVKCCKDLPGRTDNQVLQRYRRLEDWKKKTEWFKKQSVKERDLLQGNNLPVDQRTKAQERNWEQFKNKFGVFPDDYRKQQADMESGDIMVPRPPFMIGLANKSGGKVWERRIKLHKLIESHIDKLREKYNFIHPSVAGIFELQDAISQLSKDCISQRDQLMNQRKDRLGELIHGLPSAINVKDLLAVSRGGKVHEKKVRGPMLRKRKGKAIPPRLLQSMRVDSKLRQVIRSSLKERGLKKGRPRRFFWDINGDQVLCDEDIAELKSTSLGLYMKSLGADHVQLLRSGRQAFPQLFHKLQQQQFQTSDGDQDPDHTDSSSGSKPLRRSRRRYEKMKAESESPDSADPFMLSELPPNVSGFAEYQRQRDYELLEWLAREQNISVDDQLSEGVSSMAEIHAAAAVEVSTGVQSGTTMTSNRSSQPVIGQGMSLVHARIQQAIEEEEARRNQQGEKSTPRDIVMVSDGESEQDTTRGASSSGRIPPVITDGGDASTSTGTSHLPIFVQESAGVHLAQDPVSQQGVEMVTHSVPGPSGAAPAPSRQFPNLPPTSNTIQSFKNLLLKRLGLIKKAGTFYNLPFYLAKKDHQMARLIQSGLVLQDMNRGTIDLSRMMNRVSQETDYLQPKKRKSRRDKEEPTIPPLLSPVTDCKQFDFRVLESVRKTEEFQLLKSRFLSVFTWPALLSAIYPPFQRKEYCRKAGGHTHKHLSHELPSYQSERKRPPMLKSKGFYRYVNKTKEDKKKCQQKLHQRRILQQVRQLMADEDDPKPHVTMTPDSDDETFSGNRPAEDPESQSPPKRKRKAYTKRFRFGHPLRQSSRVTERKVYMDSINRKRGPRKRHSDSDSPRIRVRSARPTRLHPTVRKAMINAMVEVRNKESHKHGTKLGQWNPGGYVSDDDTQDVEKELENGGDWVSELPSELQDNLAVLERESIVETEPSAQDGKSATTTTTTFPTPMDIDPPAPPSETASAGLPESSSTNTSTTDSTAPMFSSIDLTSPTVSSIDLTATTVSSARPSENSEAAPSRHAGLVSLSQTSMESFEADVDAELNKFHRTVEQIVSTQEPRGHPTPSGVLLESDEEEMALSVASLLAAKRAKR